MSYKLLSSTLPSILEQRVNECIADGWELVGQPFTTHDKTYCQAMICRQMNVLDALDESAVQADDSPPAPAPKKKRIRRKVIRKTAGK